MIENEIRALDRMLDRLDYYKLFKVERRAQLPAIQQAYRDARRRFDPDSFLNAAPEVRAAVDRIARRITEGYLALRDPRRRSAYDAALQGGAVRYTAEIDDESQAQADEARGATANGKRFVAMADVEERKGNLKTALQHLKMALTFEPRNAALKARLERIQKKSS
jgi:DnaJ-class molecular chaperone